MNLTKTNNSTKQLRKNRLVIGVLAVAAALVFLSGCLSAEQQDTFDRVNKSRTSRNIRALPTHQQAQKKAQAWAERLAREGRIYHSTLSNGYSSGSWCNLGENVGYGSSLARVHTGFMNSTRHRNNILSTTWNGLGVGVAKRGNTFYVVHEFIRTC